MSHIVEAKTTVRSPDLVLLRQAVELVAQQHGGQVKARYQDYSGKPHAVSTGLVLFTPQVTRGIGLEVNAAGELLFIGDPFRYEDQAEAVQQQIVQTYVSLATMQALQVLGYTTQAVEGAQAGQVVVQGVSYGA